MNIPSYMCIICNLSGDIIQSPSEISYKSIFELIEPLSLSKFKTDIKNILANGNFLEIRKLQLIDGKQYHVTFEVSDTSKLCFHFKKCTNEIKDTFWEDTISKYDYYINRARNVIQSTSLLIQDIFYKNRSDINSILKQLCESLNIQFAIVLFRNGCDHLIYCKNILSGYECSQIENEHITFDDYKFNENVRQQISETFKIKMYKDTYMKIYCEDIIPDNKNVYLLKLMFGPKEIGYFEFATHSNIQLTPSEIKLVQSLSSILAYVINNKYEQIEIEKYIKEKFNINK